MEDVCIVIEEVREGIDKAASDKGIGKPTGGVTGDATGQADGGRKRRCASSAPPRNAPQPPMSR